VRFRARFTGDGEISAKRVHQYVNHWPNVTFPMLGD
jgi:hypothetical protein